MFGSIVGQLGQAGLCPRTAGPGWLVSQDGWPRLACVLEYCRTAGPGWLVFCSIAGRLAKAHCVQ